MVIISCDVRVSTRWQRVSCLLCYMQVYIYIQGCYVVLAPILYMTHRHMIHSFNHHRSPDICKLDSHRRQGDNIWVWLNPIPMMSWQNCDGRLDSCTFRGPTHSAQNRKSHHTHPCCSGSNGASQIHMLPCFWANSIHFGRMVHYTAGGIPGFSAPYFFIWANDVLIMHGGIDWYYATTGATHWAWYWELQSSVAHL